MNLSQVRRWARKRGVRSTEFSIIHDASLLHVISRLLQAIHRESGITRLWQDPAGQWHLDVGRDAVLRAEASGPLPFSRLEVSGRPWLVGPPRRRRVRSARSFLAALEACLMGTQYERVFPELRADFENSVANVVLNRLIGRTLDATTSAIEPASEGHQYYPFPALRIGPTLDLILACSHLARDPIRLPLLEMADCRLVSVTYQSYEAWLTAWSGLNAEANVAALLPVHPWQLRLSPVVREALKCGLAKPFRDDIEVIPLAAQRTCRVLRTGFDIKLPVNATLTGEHRLLYQLNCENACMISALAKRLRDIGGCETIDFQEDVATMIYAAPTLAPHLSAIIRSPAPERPGETLVPAINLWAGRVESRRLLQGAGSNSAEAFFELYCRALMIGPVRYCTEWGMAFEPHLQNVYVAFQGGLPRGIVVRDLDASVLHQPIVRPVLRAMGLDLARNTWEVMPDYQTGSKRMVQAMLFGHLGEVMSRLVEITGVRLDRLSEIVEDQWSDLSAAAPSPSVRKAVQELRGWSDAVKATLWTRLARGTRMEFVGM